MNRKFLFTAIVTCMALMFTGCTKDEYNDQVILFAPDTLRLCGDGDIRELNFLSSGTADTRLQSDAAWLTLNEERIGQALHCDLVAATNTTGAVRQSVLTISYGEASREVVVRQGEATDVGPFLKLDAVSNALPNAGGHATLRLLSNAGWKVSVPETADWITIDEGRTTGNGPAIIGLTAAPNTDVNTPRTATLTISLTDVPDVKQEVVVRQDAYAETLSLSATSLTFGKEQGSRASLIVRTTADWQLADVPAWLSADRLQSSGFMQRDTITFTATVANSTDQARSATVRLMAGSTELATIHVEQGAESITQFSLSEDNVRVSTFQSGDGSIGNLFDGDPSTYFTTYWNSYDVTVPQWIVVDLGEEAIDKVCFRYQNRNKLDYVPSRVLLQVTDEGVKSAPWQKEGDAYTDADRAWRTVAAYEGEPWCPVKAGAASGDLVGQAEKKYRYWRFYVEKARQNPTYAESYPDAFCFQISELQLYLYH